MKKFLSRTGIFLFCVWLTAFGAGAVRMLIPVGQVVGLELGDNTVTIAAFDEEAGMAAQEAGLQVGDRILTVNGRQICTAEDVREALSCSDGAVKMTVMRSKKTADIHLNPQITADGPKLGVYLKQGITGVGTITWYDPDSGRFATLGHGVNNSSGELLNMVSGAAYNAAVVSVKKGTCGNPGQLMGTLRGTEPIGILYKNSVQGVFGTTETGWKGEPLPAGQPSDVKTGPAVIRCTVQGDTAREYSVKILKVYPHSGTSGRNMLLQITDPALLEATGGIVQGMGVSYNRDNTGTLNSLQGFGDSPGFSLTKRNPCTCAGTQGTPHSSAMIKLNE